MSATAPEQAPPLTVHLATVVDRENIITALTEGFANDVVVAGWLFNDPATYTRYAGGYFACYTDFALEHGHIFTADGISGALITMPFQAWLRSGQDRGLKEKIIRATGPYAERVFTLDQALAGRHPLTPDHLYGALLGVVPHYRSQGLGIRLLQAFWDFADRLQVPIYGEGSNELNSRLYNLVGCVPYGGPLSIPGCDSPVFPVWRDPAPSPSQGLRPADAPGSAKVGLF